LDITLKPQQVEFIGAPEQFSAYIGGVGTGKSTSLIAKVMFHSQESPKNLGVVIRKNFTDLRDSTLRDFEDYTGLKVKSEAKEVTLQNGSTIMFRHGDELPTLKNVNLGWFAIEQAEEFGDSMPWDMLIQRLRRQVIFRTGFLVANANGHNWVWDKFIHQTRENHFCVQASTYDFKDILPADYIENMEKNLPAPMFRRYVLNSHEEAEGLCYSEYNESIHVVDNFEIPETWERGFVLDHGYRNPTGVLWYAIDFDGTMILYDEHYETEQPISYHAEKIKERGLTNGIADPSIFSKTQQSKSRVYSIADEYSEYGILLRSALREEEYAAIARVNEFFKAKRIKIFKSLVNARHEFGNWKWKPKKPMANPQNLVEEPEDYMNHLADGLKYIIQTRFPKSDKPEPKPVSYSLDYYEKQEEHNERLKWPKNR